MTKQSAVLLKKTHYCGYSWQPTSHNNRKCQQFTYSMSMIPECQEEKRKCQKIKWSHEEDQQLLDLVTKYGASKWNHIASYMTRRTGKQCRERYITNLSPVLNKKEWDVNEDVQLINLHNMYGNQWSTISNFYAGRNAIAVKNRWNYLQRREIPDQYNRIVPSNTQITKTEKVPTIEYQEVFQEESIFDDFDDSISFFPY